MSRKQLLANILDKIFPFEFLLNLRALIKDELIVLAYHRVCDIDKNNYKFDMELVSANSEDFEYQIKYLKKYYNPINIDKLIDHIENGTRLPKKSVLITFDDGFDDNYLNAFPILKKYDVPAVIFVTTGYVGSEQSIWFEKFASLIFSIDDTHLEIREINKSYNLGKIKSKRGHIMETITEDLKLIPDFMRKMILKRLINDYSDYIKNINYTQSKMLNWDQIVEMQKSVISIGGHTVTHPVLTKLKDSELEYELRESKIVLEEKLNTEIYSMSYPNGNADAFNKKVIEAVKNENYKIAFTYISANNPLPISDRYCIKRLHIEHYTSRSYFKILLCLPAIFGAY